MRKSLIFGVGLLAFAMLIGCGGEKKKVAADEATELPIFSLATSEYPSWSTFVVAKKAGLINGTDTGEPGKLEKKWGVRMRLDIADYDPCLTKYGGGTVDAVCITNIDTLNPAMSRNSTVILPTSTSNGADKVIGVGYKDFVFATRDRDTSDKAKIAAFLKGKTTHGLSKSVSEYVFVRGLQINGLTPSDYPFKNLDPAAAATAIQTGSKDVQAACIWNPFALQTLRTSKTTGVLWDSSAMPEEVIDMVVMSTSSLNKDGGDKFAALICDVFYTVCKKMDDPASSDATYKALGAEFSNLGLDDMRLCCKETRFYNTPQAGMKLFDNLAFTARTMPLVIKTCAGIGILDKGHPTIGTNDPDKQLNFSTTYMQKVAASKN